MMPRPPDGYGSSLERSRASFQGPRSRRIPCRTGSEVMIIAVCRMLGRRAAWWSAAILATAQSASLIVPEMGWAQSRSSSGRPTWLTQASPAVQTADSPRHPPARPIQPAQTGHDALPEFPRVDIWQPSLFKLDMNGATGDRDAAVDSGRPAAADTQQRSALVAWTVTPNEAPNSRFIGNSAPEPDDAFRAGGQVSVDVGALGVESLSGVRRLQEPETSQDREIQLPIGPGPTSARQWSWKGIEQLPLEEHPDRRRPDNQAADLLRAMPTGQAYRGVEAATVSFWVAPEVSYQPLLFEDPRLERHGYASPYFGVQPIRSGFHFTNSFLLSPFRAWIHRHEMESPLEFERAGSHPQPRREIFVPRFSSHRPW